MKKKSPNKDWRSKNESKIYQALGKFVVEFSHLHSMMQLMILQIITNIGSKEEHNRAWVLISDITTYPVVVRLFSLLMHDHGDFWESEDIKVINRTRIEITDLIEKRNRILHDIWYLGHPNLPIDEHFDAYRVRDLTSPKTGYSAVKSEIKVDDIEELSSDLIRLRQVIIQIGAIGMDRSRKKKPTDEIVIDQGGNVQLRSKV